MTVDELQSWGIIGYVTNKDMMYWPQVVQIVNVDGT